MSQSPHDTGIRTATSRADETSQCADELHDALMQPDLCLVLLFVRTNMDLAGFAESLTARFGPDIPVVGCTTAGELTSDGFVDGAVTGVSFSASHFAASVLPIHDLDDFSLGQAQELVRTGLLEIADQRPTLTRTQTFGLTLIDGLSYAEESLTSTLHAAMGDIPLFGGSAGDSLHFKQTHILYKGTFHSAMALLILIGSRFPFRVFKTEHFIAGNKKMVVTEADPSLRIVSEINAEPAAKEYARLIGMQEEDLTSTVFATHPVVVRVGGQNFVRSIQKRNEDGSLSFFCAIDKGIVLTLAEGIDLTRNLADLFEGIRRTIGKPILTLGFDCIFRTLEIRDKHLRPAVDNMLCANNVIGFATYGEQFQAMHVNQTFTGVAIGDGDYAPPSSG